MRTVDRRRRTDEFGSYEDIDRVHAARKSANKGRLTNDLPELKAIANELGKKFGKAFAVSCEREKTSEACGVSKRFIAAIAKCEKKERRERIESDVRADGRI